MSDTNQELLAICKRLYNAIDEKGVSYGDLAKTTGIPKSAIHRYATGETLKIPLDRLVILSHALNISPTHIMGWDEEQSSSNVDDNIVSFPVLGNIAASFDHFPDDYFAEDYVDVPSSYLRGRAKEDFFALRVDGDSMSPTYLNGDIILCVKAQTVESGTVAAVVYNSEYASLKKIVKTETGVVLVPINPAFDPIPITGTDLEQFHVQGIPKLVLRYL